MRGLSPSHRGVYAGVVLEPPKKNTVRVRVRAALAISAGDGVGFGVGEEVAGGAVWGVHDESKAAAAGEDDDEEVEVTLELEDAAKLRGVAKGDLVWRTQHQALAKQLKSALSDRSAGRCLVDVTLSGALGEPLTVTVTDGRGRAAAEQTAACLEAASGEPLSEQALKKAVGQLGGTPLAAARVDVSVVVALGAWQAPCSTARTRSRCSPSS